MNFLPKIMLVSIAIFVSVVISRIVINKKMEYSFYKLGIQDYFIHIASDGKKSHMREKRLHLIVHGVAYLLAVFVITGAVYIYIMSFKTSSFRARSYSGFTTSATHVKASIASLLSGVAFYISSAVAIGINLIHYKWYHSYQSIVMRLDSVHFAMLQKMEDITIYPNDFFNRVIFFNNSIFFCSKLRFIGVQLSDINVVGEKGRRVRAREKFYYEYVVVTREKDYTFKCENERYYKGLIDMLKENDVRVVKW